MEFGLQRQGAQSRIDERRQNQRGEQIANLDEVFRHHRDRGYHRDDACQKQTPDAFPNRAPQLGVLRPEQTEPKEQNQDADVKAQKHKEGRLFQPEQK